MGLFSCCRSDKAADENAYGKRLADAEKAARRGDNFDEDLQAVMWMRERSLERSLERGLKSMSDEDIIKFKNPSFDELIPKNDNVPEITSRLSDPKTPLIKNTANSIEILEDLLDESRRSQQEIKQLQDEAQETLRILSKTEVEAAEREERHDQKIERRWKREQRKSKKQPKNVGQSQNQQPKRSPATRVSPSIRAATQSLVRSKEKNSKHTTSTLSGIPDLQLEPDLEVKGNVDPTARDRYLVAVQLLHRRIIQKQETLSAAEKQFLHDLLRLKEDDESTIDERISEIESTIERLDSNHRLGADILSTDSLKARTIPYSMSNDDRKSDVSVDIHSVTSSTSGVGVEATWGRWPRTNRKKRARAKKEDSSESSLKQPDPPDLSTEDDVDDLQDSTFPVLGADSIQNRLLTVRLMEALRGFLPYAVSEQNFWLKFSLERDGCSLRTLLHKMQGCQSCLLVIQAKGDENHIFGAYTSNEWRRHDRWYGNGQSFLFKRNETLEVYPFTGSDDMVQYCSAQMMAVGGGDWSVSSPFGDTEATGIGLLLDGDLQGGESYSSATFCNPRLSPSNEFSILNVEVWTLTPCMTEVEAEKLIKHKIFVESNRR
jgi:hypothetical protein